MTDTFDEAISRARVTIMRKHNTVFLTALMMGMDCLEKESIPTAGTDYKNIYFNPKWFTDLNKDERVGLLCHELWHVAFMHGVRRGDKEHKRWNRACDYAINIMLVDEGFTLPPKGCVDAKYRGMSAEEIYELLPEELESDGIGDDLMDVPEEELKEAVAKAQEMVARASMQAQMANQADTVPSEIGRAIEEFRNPQLPWLDILVQYMHDKVKEDYTWTRRNRRNNDIYLPTMYSEGLGEIRGYFDCSGSISDEVLQKEAAEMRGIKDITNPSKMTLRAFACDLGAEQDCYRDEDLTFVADTSGGTNIEPIFNDLREHPETEIAVIFTDGEYNHPINDGIKTDIIFVIVGNREYVNPYGYTVLHLEA